MRVKNHGNGFKPRRTPQQAMGRNRKRGVGGRQAYPKARSDCVRRRELPFPDTKENKERKKKIATAKSVFAIRD